MGHPSGPGAFRFSHKLAAMYISYLTPKDFVRIIYGMGDAKPRNAKTTTEVPGRDARNAPDTSPAPREREGESAPPESVDPLAPPPVDLARVDLPAPFNDAVLEAPADATPEVVRLRAAQRQALECLMQGMGYVETASRVNIDRRTLYRWVNQDPEFHKALESWRAVAVRSAEDRLLRGIELAATRLSYAAARDYRAASILLKGRGLLPGVAPAPPPAARAGRDAKVLPTTISPARKDEFYARLSELWHTFIFNDPPAPDPGPPADETALAPRAGGDDHCE